MCELVPLEEAADKLALYAAQEMAKILKADPNSAEDQNLLIDEYELKYQLYMRMELEELEHLYLYRILGGHGSVTVFDPAENNWNEGYDFPEEDPDLPLWANQYPRYAELPLTPTCPVADVQ